MPNSLMKDGYLHRKKKVITLYFTHQTVSRGAGDLGIDFAADVHDKSYEVQPQHSHDVRPEAIH